MFVRTNLQTRKWLSRSGVFQNLLVEKIEPAPLQDENFHFGLVWFGFWFVILKTSKWPKQTCNNAIALKYCQQNISIPGSLYPSPPSCLESYPKRPMGNTIFGILD